MKRYNFPTITEQRPYIFFIFKKCVDIIYVCWYSHVLWNIWTQITCGFNVSAVPMLIETLFF